MDAFTPCSNAQKATSRRLWITAFIVVVTSLCHVQSATAQSLWQYRHPSKAFMLFDSQARDIGDTITIVIQEDTDVANTDQRAVDRSDTSGGSFNFTGATGGELGSIAGDANLENSSASEGSQSGSARVKVDRQFRDRITAVVVDKLPNGNLVVQGVRHRIVTGERRTLRVSGIVRPIDIRADNSIDSQYVAGFTMFYAGDGHDSRFTRESWLSRKLNQFRISQLPGLH